ncbi:hypothetical protein Z517_05762 [Fonsecaea pedrosoi CBS 271.37]|uniref:Unplaced genomic scaffold supercont1.4, whole genome shotgun sequence n=1 Tax=Fonsecaea pedrosoi CBS 271.37 TaxID=1442368 RepID=A0A0D2GKU9_9EURO|nr:uncharacterized protein Z517_05762 [Fonsecaea pedrosoi CBS 271.37]KIW79150.1 hypothetical protein Z517_05762 [Fonsecaea pedrosoi CBS 271.37]
MRTYKGEKIEDWIDGAIQVDNDYQEYKRHDNYRRGFVVKGQRSNTKKQRQPYYGPMPMDLNQVQKKRGTTQGKDTKQGRKPNGLRNQGNYYNYGKPSHYARECKSPKKQANQAEPQKKN